MYPGSDLEGDTRESANLEVGLKMPEIKRRPMPVMSDSELYLRLGVPDGLQVSPDQPTKIDYSSGAICVNPPNELITRGIPTATNRSLARS